MKKLTSLFAGFVIAASTFLAACGGQPVAYDYEEYDQPCYQNQRPDFQDGDYYIFNCGDRYRRVRRDRIVYVDNPVYIPIITDTDRNRVYRTMPRTTRRSDSGVTRSTGVQPSTSSPSYPSTGTKPSGVQRSTSSNPPSRPTTTSPSTSSPQRSTSSSPSRSTSSSSSSSSSSPSRSTSSSPSRSTSSRRP